jgi:SAM-dependent methyltransferase
MAMPAGDEIARYNKAFWDTLAAEGFVYTRPWLDLDVALLEDFASGKLPVMPAPHAFLFPQAIFADLAGQKVLCLASGGGQQSAAFALLGAEVTVLDLSEKQLAADREAAAHYGYEVQTVQGDMRDLSCFADSCFDRVYQAISLAFVPDLREVYREVARVLEPGGLYAVGHVMPGTTHIEQDSWNGKGYLSSEPYRPGLIEDDEWKEYIHPISDMFGGLVEAGLEVRGVWEDPRHLFHDESAEPGSYEHLLTVIVSYFMIMARKTEGKR